MKRKLFIILALVLCMALMVGVLAACNEGGTTGTGGDDTQGDVTPGGDDEQGGNTPGGDDENQGGNTPGGNTPGGNPGGDFPWNPGGDDDDDTPGGDFPWNPGGDDDEPVIPVPGGEEQEGIDKVAREIESIAASVAAEGGYLDPYVVAQGLAGRMPELATSVSVTLVSEGGGHSPFIAVESGYAGTVARRVTIDPSQVEYFSCGELLLDGGKVNIVAGAGSDTQSDVASAEEWVRIFDEVIKEACLQLEQFGSIISSITVEQYFYAVLGIDIFEETSDAAEVWSMLESLLHSFGIEVPDDFEFSMPDVEIIIEGDIAANGNAVLTVSSAVSGVSPVVITNDLIYVGVPYRIVIGPHGLKGEWKYNANGLIFSYAKDGEGLAVVDHRDSCPADVDIPAAVHGVTVTEISGGLPSYINSVSIPAGVNALPLSVINSKIAEYIVDESNPTYRSIDGNLYSKDGRTLIRYATGSSQTTFAVPSSVTKIEGYAFEGCYMLESISVPSSVTEIGEYAFANSSLHEAILNYGVDVISSHMFYDCDSLVNVVIPVSVTEIEEYAFAGCSSLESIVIPASVKSIGDRAFFDCTALERPELPEDVVLGDSVFVDDASAAWDAMIDKLDAVRADENEVKEFAFGFEIAEKGEGDAADERIFGVVFDSVDEYLYINAGKGGEYVKFNGFDLGHLVITVLDDWLGLYGESIAGLVPVTADGFKSDMVLGSILMNFIGECFNEGDAYMFEIDPGAIIDFVIGDGTEDNPGLIDIDIDAVLADAADEETLTTVKNILASIIPEVNADMEFSEIFRVVGDNYTTRAYFGFADTAETAEGADLFGGLVEGFAEASEEEAVNILNFKGKINIEGKDAAGNSNAAYVADIVLDVDPFALMPMFDLVKGNKPMPDGTEVAEGFKLEFVDFEIGDIIAMLENLGYIHISVDEVKSASDPTPVKNLFTLHYDSAEGKAVISAATNEVGGEQLALGGVYDVEALAKVVDKLIKDAATSAAEAPPVHDHGEADHNGNYACDRNDNMVCDETGEIINTEGLIEKIVGVLAESLGIDMEDVEGYLNGIGTNGIVIGFEPILDYTETLLADLTDLDTVTVGSLRGTVEELIASDSLTFKVPAKAFSYGTVTKADYVGYEDLLYNLREDETFTSGDAYVSEITSIDTADGSQVEAGDIVNVTGKGFDGETVETTGVVMYVIDGVYYVGIHTDLYANLEVLKDIVAEVDENVAAAIVIPAEWPFYGVLAYAPQA